MIQINLDIETKTKCVVRKNIPFKPIFCAAAAAGGSFQLIMIIKIRKHLLI